MRWFYAWHRRLGWVLAPFLVLSAASGLVLLWLQPLPAARAPAPDPAAWAQALDQGLATLRQRHPAAQADLIDLPRDADAPLRVHLRAPEAADTGWALLDARTGTAGALQPDHRDAQRYVLALHEALLVDGAGPWVLRGVALAALGLLAMGLRIWWRVRRLPPRTPLRRWHRRLGPWLLAPVTAVLCTGFLLRTPELPRAVLGGVPERPRAAQAPAGPPASAGRWLQAGAAALPHARPTRLYAPRDGVVRLRLRAGEWNPYGLHDVYLDAASAAVLRVVRADEQPPAVRYLDVVYPLHTAWLPGDAGPVATLLLRLLWSAGALGLAALAVSGAAQALRRTP